MKNIKLHIGEGSQIDGAKFIAFRVTKEEGNEIVGTDDSVRKKAKYKKDKIEDSLKEEIKRGEPVSITSVTKEDGFITISVPFRREFELSFSRKSVRKNDDFNIREIQSRVDKEGCHFGPLN